MIHFLIYDKSGKLATTLTNWFDVLRYKGEVDRIAFEYVA